MKSKTPAEWDRLIDANRRLLTKVKQLTTDNERLTLDRYDYVLRMAESHMEGREEERAKVVEYLRQIGFIAAAKSVEDGIHDVPGEDE